MVKRYRTRKGVGDGSVRTAVFNRLVNWDVRVTVLAGTVQRGGEAVGLATVNAETRDLVNKALEDVDMYLDHVEGLSPLSGRTLSVALKREREFIIDLIAKIRPLKLKVDSAEHNSMDARQTIELQYPEIIKPEPIV